MRLTMMVLVFVLGNFGLGKSAWALSPTEIPTLTESPTAVATLVPTITGLLAEESKSANDLSKWFLIITISLLALIIVVQFWPEKKEKIE